MKNEKFILLILSILFFGIYSWFGFASPNIFNSPDETANYFYIAQYAQNGDFFTPESLNLFLENRLHPRSISFNGFSLVPHGFIGMPLLYGFISKFLGLFLVRFLTPLLAVLGATCFYFSIKKIFNSKVALLSFIFLLILPPFWYYASRAFYPNVAFVSLILIALWAGVYGAFKEGAHKVYLIIFSLCLGCALILRPAEALWILPAVLFLVNFYRKEIPLIRAVYFTLILGFLAIPVLAHNYFLYGGILESGYTLKSAVEVGSTATVFFSKISMQDILGKIFPFGFHPRTALQNIIEIFVKFLWWYSLPFLFGFFVWLFGRKNIEQKLYSIIFLGISAWLAIFYGSGVFLDNPNARITIGDSHFRYWLPVFILTIPYISLFWIFLTSTFRHYAQSGAKRRGDAESTKFLHYPKIYAKLFLSAVLLFSLLLATQMVYFSLDDGLLQVRENLENNFETKKEVLKITNKDDIIITARQDKIFFPDRRVLYVEKITDKKLLEDLARIKNNNFYYFTIGLHNEELKDINEVLGGYGFGLKREKIFDKEVLYQLSAVSYKL